MSVKLLSNNSWEILIPKNPITGIWDNPKSLRTECLVNLIPNKYILIYSALLQVTAFTFPKDVFDVTCSLHSIKIYLLNREPIVLMFCNYSLQDNILNYNYIYPATIPNKIPNFKFDIHKQSSGTRS